MFVDQPPLQNRAPGWELGSKGCYDEASLRALCGALERDVGEVADGNAAGAFSGEGGVGARARGLRRGGHPPAQPSALLGAFVEVLTRLRRAAPPTCARFTATHAHGHGRANPHQNEASKPHPRGKTAGCLSLPIPPAVAALLRAETLRCDGGALGELMRDHTQLDWRALLPRIRAPCLVVAGGRSGCFPVEGCLSAAEAVPDCAAVVFERANHW